MMVIGEPYSVFFSFTGESCLFPFLTRIDPTARLTRWHLGDLPTPELIIDAEHCVRLKVEKHGQGHGLWWFCFIPSKGPCVISSEEPVEARANTSE